MSACLHGLPVLIVSLSGSAGPVQTQITRMQLSHLAGEVEPVGQPVGLVLVRVSAHGWTCPWPWEPPQVRGTTWTGASGFLHAYWVLSKCRRCQASLARLGFTRSSCSLALTGFLPSAAAAREGSQEPHVLCVNRDPREHSAARLGGRGQPSAIFSTSS